MTFKIVTKSAPLGFFSHLRISEPEEEIWKTYPCEVKGMWSAASGNWGKSEEEAHRLLQSEIAKEIKDLLKKKDLRPSQSRRIDMLKDALSTLSAARQPEKV
jgi:hypothetical protein